MLVLVGTLAACAQVEPAKAPPVPPTYAELMASAEDAGKKGALSDAIESFERAAESDTAKKQPWLRIAQIQFEARNYGEAIAAASQVLQRDATDVTAKSILTASGLRVSASGLQQLRAADAVSGTTRDEAESLARIMKEALGAPVFPVPAEAPPPVQKPKLIRKPIARPPVSLPKPADAAPAPATNPFNALKG